MKKNGLMWSKLVYFDLFTKYWSLNTKKNVNENGFVMALQLSSIFLFILHRIWAVVRKSEWNTSSYFEQRMKGVIVNCSQTHKKLERKKEGIKARALWTCFQFSNELLKSELIIRTLIPVNIVVILNCSRDII